MKKRFYQVLCLLIVLVMAISLFQIAALGEAGSKIDPKKELIRISTTTSVNDSGLIPYLQPVFEKETPYKIEVTSAGTGAAIAKGKSGDADLLLVHAKSSEEEFINEGFSKERIPFMYNFFVIVGPSKDPAGIKGCSTAAESFKKIAESKSTFISRGDDSGTHKAELKIWKSAEISPDSTKDKWYISAGTGMGACLNMAEEMQAYVLTDKATYLTNKKTLDILLEKADDMKNTYSLLIINPEKWPDTNVEGAAAFVKWITSENTLKLINEYGVEKYGQPLFFAIEPIKK